MIVLTEMQTEGDNVSVRSSKGVAVGTVNDDDNSWTDVNLDEHREDLRPSQQHHFIPRPFPS